jgi:hypothetical protein
MSNVKADTEMRGAIGQSIAPGPASSAVADGAPPVSLG